MKGVLALICVIGVTGASFVGSAAGGAAATTTVPLGELDLQVLATVNRTRVEHGLRRLVLSSGLDRAARSHSKQMLERGFFDHDTPGGLPFAKRLQGFYGSDGFTTWSAGENLLYSSVEITAQAAVKAWLNSTEHRENLLSPAWREVGIASVRAQVAGGTFGGKSAWVITMDFGARTGKAAGSNSTVTSRSAIAQTKPTPKSGATGTRNTS